MMTAKGLYLPSTQRGSGLYGETHGKQTATLLDPVKQKVMELVKTIPFIDKQAVFNIGDYGSADGTAAMTFIRDLIVTLREKHSPKVQFQIIYEDQHINDFNSLFKRLSGIIPVPPPYLNELENVYPLASGISFYKQCVPSDSMHFIFSVAAVHWLSKTPVVYKQGWYINPQSSLDEKEAVYKQADRDWESFLLMRSKELKQGGIMLVITTNRDDDGMNSFTLKETICIFSEIWISFKNTGKITNDEFMNANLSLAMHSLKQLTTPFDDINSNVSKSGLRLLSAEVFTTQNFFYSTWKEKLDQTGIDDREEFARSYVASNRSWSNNTFINALSDSRTEQQKTDIVDELYVKAEEALIKMELLNFRDAYADGSCIIMRKE